MPTDDPLFGKGTIRADGRKIHDAYLFEVKKPRSRSIRATSTICAPPSRRPRRSVRSRTAMPAGERLILTSPAAEVHGEAGARGDPA
jgi:hypothetical protein